MNFYNCHGIQRNMMRIKKEDLNAYVNVFKNLKLDKKQLVLQLKLLCQQINPIISWINLNWIIIVIFLLIFGVLIASFGYNISIFQPLEEIAARQKEYKIRIIERTNQQQEKEFHARIVKSHLKLGNAFLYDKHYKTAADQFKKTLRLDKMNLEAQMGLLITDIYISLKNHTYTPDILRKQIYVIISDVSTKGDYEYLHPKAHANILYGNLYTWLKKFGTAKAYYYKALQLDQNASSAYFGLGFICQKQEMIEQAIYFFQKALEQSNWNEKYLTHLANAYSLKNRFDQAIEKYELMITLDKTSLLIYYEIANIYSLQNNPSLAASYLERLINMLNDKNYTSLEKNQKPWMVGKTSILKTINEKKFYVLKCFAAALRALNEKEFAQAIENTADLLPIENKEMINGVMSFKKQ